MAFHSCGITIEPTQILLVIVPVKTCLTSLFQTSEKFLLYFLKKIETDKYIFIELEFNIFILYHTAVKHAFIGKATTFQIFVKLLIDSRHLLPEFYKTLFQISRVGIEEMKEVTDATSLFFTEISEVRPQIFIGFHIAEEFVDRCHVFIHVIKIGQELLSPSVKVSDVVVIIIVGLLSCCRAVTLVEREHKVDVLWDGEG